MKIENRDPFYFTQAGIKEIEDMRDAKYMGYWCGKTKDGGWAERPLDVFYQEDPDTEAGHSNYFGLLVKGDQVLITDAKSCFSEPMQGIVEEDVVYVSRYRHDFVQTPSGQAIDGGRDYVKLVGDSTKTITINVKDGEFLFEKVDLDVQEEQE